MKKRSKAEMKRLRDAYDSHSLQSNTTKEIKRRCRKARNFPTNTCPASRHIQMIGENLLSDGFDWMMIDEPIEIGTGMLVCATLIYEMRTEIEILKRRIFIA